MRDKTTAPDEGDDRPLDPADMLKLLETQQRSVQNQFGSFVTLITAGWGIAWLVGFGALWLIDGLKPHFSLPAPIAAATLGTLLAIAMVISIVGSVRSNRGVKASREAAFSGTVYGCTWSVAMIGVWVLGLAMRSYGMPPEFLNFFFTSGFVLMAGVLFMVSAALWPAVPALIVGVWLVLVAAVAPFFGTPGNYLFLSISGGGAFILLSIGNVIHTTRLKRASSGTGVHHG